MAVLMNTALVATLTVTGCAKNGPFVETYPNGDRYVGTFKDDKRSGEGRMNYSTGMKYVGGWEDDKRSGWGAVTFRDGSTAAGEFKDDQMNGQGSLTLSDGTKFTGRYEDGHLVNGRATFPSGAQYIGEFKDSKPNGQGTETLPNGANYQGEWQKGERNGQGTLAWPDDMKGSIFIPGGKYVGEFKDGMPSGNKVSGNGTYSEVQRRGDVQGFCKEGDVERVVSAGQPGIVNCRMRAIARSPELQGKVTMNWRIGVDGKVMRVFVENSTLNNKEVEGCVMRQVERWAFPKPDGGTCQISYPFVFRGHL